MTPPSSPKVDKKKANIEKMKTKNSCDVCGGKYTTNNVSKHIKTNKHLKAVAASIQPTTE